MTANSYSGLIAVDVGSSRIKAGWFPPAELAEQRRDATEPTPPALPEPAATLAIQHRGRDATAWAAEFTSWLRQVPKSRCFIASVHPEAAETVIRLLNDAGASQWRELSVRDLGLQVNVSNPNQVGVDRLLNVLAVNEIRPVGAPAIIIGAGTAVTISVVNLRGDFEGGAILPGAAMAIRALHHETAALPLPSIESIADRPPPLGKSTEGAMAAGVVCGLVGGVGRLIELYEGELAESPSLYVTGGSARFLVEQLRRDRPTVRHLPHLTLAGIALAATRRDRP